MGGLAVDGQSLEFAVRGDEQRAAGRFVRAARLHADEAIFHNVGATDSVLRGDFIELVEKIHRTELRAVYGNGRACFEADLDFFSLVRRFIRRRSEEHTSELQSQSNLVCRLLLE